MWVISISIIKEGSKSLWKNYVKSRLAFCGGVFKSLSKHIILVNQKWFIISSVFDNSVFRLFLPGVPEVL